MDFVTRDLPGKSQQFQKYLQIHAGLYQFMTNGTLPAQAPIIGVCVMEQEPDLIKIRDRVQQRFGDQFTHHIMRAIPVIGIGAGPGCDGQVLVLHDMLGLSEQRFHFVKRYAELGYARGHRAGGVCEIQKS
jgi:hypothetical protein